LSEANAPFKLSDSGMLSEQLDDNSIFNLSKGPYFGENLTYKDFQRSGIMAVEKGINKNSKDMFDWT
jgi:hypothetical protein